MNSSQAIGSCTPAGIPLPTIFGAEFLSITADTVQNYTSDPGNSDLVSQTGNNAGIDFCNITLTHTHPGKNTTLRTQIWLPSNATWNNRWVMAGGGGWSAGFGQAYPSMAVAVGDGYATSTVDGGIENEDSNSAAAWALTSPGNVDYEALVDFASRGLIDGALASKSVIQNFYGKEPEYSYWNGCSQGGRQGYMFAQRYPDVFDGIAANAPAINWNSLFSSSLFPQQVLFELGIDDYPHPCEYVSLYEAAIAACDSTDGLIDGLISDPDRCFFNSQTLIGTPASQCNSTANRTISEAAALAMNAVWHGPRTTNGTNLWYGHGYEVNPSTSILNSSCTNDTCEPARRSLFTSWLRYFLKKDPDYDINNMTRAEYVSAIKAGQREYASIINTDSPDLSEFRAAGGKLITYHGLADPLIPFGGTRDYYTRVSALDPEVSDFYRYFEAPGASHCAAGRGGEPDSFKALVEWVENGKAPESLDVEDPQGRERKLCAYPQKAVFQGSAEGYSAEDFVCQ